MLRHGFALTIALLLAACATAEPPPPPPLPTGPVLLDWKAIIRPVERGRLDRVDEAWARALSQARGDGHEAELQALEPLTDPRAAQPDPAPPVGDYRCRTVKLGSQAEGGLSFIAYPWFKCRIEASPKGLKFVKLTGSQRPSGLLFPDTRRRMVLLGSLALGDEPAANSYGLRPDRDLVAVLERLPHGGWRLAFPWPMAESNLDLIELQPEG
jgi:hypothetical protein